MSDKNLILDLSLDFALEIIEFSEYLEVKEKYIIARQILRSGTSIDANIREAQSAEKQGRFYSQVKNFRQRNP